MVTDTEQGIKDTENKIQTLEVWGGFQKKMAEAMTVSKTGKYPPLNWTRPLNPYELLQSIERHFLEVKISMEECDIDGLIDETDYMEHLVKIANNCSMLHYQLTNYYTTPSKLHDALEEWTNT